jgi:UDPglucose 6-dehydrogenase
MKIAVIGAGYVGLANALILAQKHDIAIVDVDNKKVENINARKSPIFDVGISNILANSENISATCNLREAVNDAVYVFICVPTNLVKDGNSFDISIVNDVIKQVLGINSRITIVLKSTVPIGYTKQIKREKKIESIIFSPEFLREGFVMHDILNPSRIIVGIEKSNEIELASARKFIEFWKDIIGLEIMQKVIITNYSDAEAIKLFSNSYLALRIAFFNELDSFSMENELSTKDIIDGVCLGPRIGMSYNNPSFGYGGTCLPKDVKQLDSQFCIWEGSLIRATLSTNLKRKQHIANKIIDLVNNDNGSKTVGFYRLTPKSNSNNLHASAIIDIMRIIQQAGIYCIVYEPLLSESSEYGVILPESVLKFSIYNCLRDSTNAERYSRA